MEVEGDYWNAYNCLRMLNPPLGVGLIMSGAPMMIQGIEDTLDEHDDIQRKLDERRRMGSELDTERSSNQLRPQNNYFPIAA